MTIQTNIVNNYIQLILLSKDTRTAQQMLIDLFADCLNVLKKNPQNIQYHFKALTIIQAYCKLGLPWQPYFADYLNQAMIPYPKSEELCCQSTKSALRQLILWTVCHKNPLLPNKQELIILVYEIIHSTENTPHNYIFTDDEHCYRLYFEKNFWYWQNIQKQLVWKFKL